MPFTSNSPQHPSNRKPLPQKENPITILHAVILKKDCLFGKDWCTLLLVAPHPLSIETFSSRRESHDYLRCSPFRKGLTPLTSSSPQPPSNRKPFPQEENPMSILPAVLFKKRLMPFTSSSPNPLPIENLFLEKRNSWPFDLQFFLKRTNTQSSGCPQPPSNRKPVPQEENLMTIWPAVLCKKDCPNCMVLIYIY